MPEGRLTPLHWVLIAGLSFLTLGVGLGGSGHLTYHEAFVAQAAREMCATGNWLIPTIGSHPWLEKPPLAFWLVAGLGHFSGGISETVARLPSAAAGLCLVIGLTIFATRHYGSVIGLLAGLIQATTAWTVMRARLAEVDIILACLVTWAIVAFDRLRSINKPPTSWEAQLWRWAFFALLGLTALAKGVGFGAVLVVSVIVAVAAWDRDSQLLRRFWFTQGWVIAAALGLTWPLLIVLQHPSVLGLWALHITDRFASKPEHFIGTPWWQFLLVVLGQLLPWTPFAIIGACRSIARTFAERRGADRILWTWFTVPLLLLSLATVKSPHYAIYALPPCSVWAALGLGRLAQRLRWRGWTANQVRRAGWICFAGIGIVCALGYGVFGPRFDRRGVEWAFYERVSRQLPEGEPLVLLYNVPDWDRAPYPSPFGPVPHDLAIRLYYLNRPVSWRFGATELSGKMPSRGGEFAVIGRESDESALRRLGKVETLAQGPNVRRDRTYQLFRVVPGEGDSTLTDEQRLTQIGGKWKE